MTGSAKNPARAGRSTKEQRNTRLAEVIQMHICGASPTRIERELSPKWGITTRSIRSYLKAARNTIAVEARRLETEEGHRRLRGEMRATLRDLLYRAVIDNQIGVAAKIAEQLTRFDALARPVKTEVSIAHDIGPHTDADVLVATLEGELDRLRKRSQVMQ